MATNQFATKLQKNCHKITVILVYAVLEWILILLLLLSSLFSYLITKFAKFFGLKPSCTWCSRLDKNTPENSHFDHVCEAHGNQISNMSYCSSHNKLAEAKNLCTNCSSSSSTVAFFTWMSTGSEGGGEDDRCSCCDQIINRRVVYPQPMVLKPSLDLILEYLQKNKVGFEVDLMGKKKNDEFQENGGEKKVEVSEECMSLEVQEWDSSQTADDPSSNVGCNEDDESVFIADMLLQNVELMDSDRFICIELNDTTDESPSRLTAEDDAVQNLEALSSENIDGADAGVEGGERLSGASNEVEGGVESLRARIEAQEKALTALYAELEDERRAAAEAAEETMAMITKLQDEKAEIQMEAAQYQRMMEEQAEYDQEALQLLNDLMLKREKEKKELEKELETYRSNENITRRYSDSSNTPSIDLNNDDDDNDNDDECLSLAEFDEERVSILEELKVVEAKKLLPLLDAAESEEIMISKNMVEVELGHVYERLKALEADKDFLKHCIRSMMKGDQGMGLLQEIMQHLRDLKSVARDMDGIPLQDVLMEEED